MHRLRRHRPQQRSRRQRRRPRRNEPGKRWKRRPSLSCVSGIADFIRGFTVRAAATRFSLDQVDRVFRKFDEASPDRYNREVRRVAAGLERLFYVSPFELMELLKAFRLRQPATVLKLLAEDL